LSIAGGEAHRHAYEQVVQVACAVAFDSLAVMRGRIVQQKREGVDFSAECGLITSIRLALASARGRRPGSLTLRGDAL
jgi:hypothetical protein